MFCSYAQGACYCKSGVDGFRCDQCKQGHYDLNATDPDGCKSKSSFRFAVLMLHVMASAEVAEFLVDEFSGLTPEAVSNFKLTV